MGIRTILRSMIALYSEAIWIYFGIAIFARIEWSVNELPDPQGWMFACLAGYFSSFFIRKRFSDIRMLTVVNGLLLFILMFWNWTETSAYSSGYRWTLLLSILFLYLRSAYYVIKEPTRSQMLIRFEGNVIWYILFVLALSVNPEVQARVHLPFMAAIILSLGGMILTLYPEESQSGEMEVKVAGNSGKLLNLMLWIAGLVASLSFVVLIPMVRHALISILSGMAEGLSKLLQLAMAAVAWIISLFPVEDEGEFVVPPPKSFTGSEGSGKGIASISIPSDWIGLIFFAIGLISAAWLFTRLYPKRGSENTATVQIATRDKASFLALWKRFWLFVRETIRQWKMNFPYAYAHEIYWHFHLLKKWGRRQHLVRMRFESPQDYATRIANHPSLPLYIEHQGKSYDLKELILQLGDSYAFTYYTGGKEPKHQDWRPLIDFLKRKG